MFSNYRHTFFFLPPSRLRKCPYPRFVTDASRYEATPQPYRLLKETELWDDHLVERSPEKINIADPVMRRVLPNSPLFALPFSSFISFDDSLSSPSPFDRLFLPLHTLPSMSARS